MFDLGWTELLLIGIVALIVVGPKDLPGMFRTLGRFTGRMKGMAREFQRAMNDAADEAGVKDIAKDLKETTSAKSMGLDKLNAAADKFEKWTPGSKGKPAERGRKDPEPKPAAAEPARDAGPTLAKAAEAAPATDAAPTGQKAAPAPETPDAAGDKPA